MQYLTYHPMRNRPWTEHNCFPQGAINWWQNHHYYANVPLVIYEMDDARTEMRLIPESEWPNAATK